MPNPEQSGNANYGLSRRSFVRGSVLTSASAAMIDTASAIIGTVEAKEANAAPLIGPDPVPIVLRVNGTDRILQIEPRMTLAEALRGPLGLTGTKIACNRGACSACTVWLDDVTVCACMMLAIEVGARNVTTIEGLAVGDKLHPVQSAFIEHDALQCGFCTPGMVMSCAALLEHKPNPTADDVNAAISGHICRCGSYPHVVTATLAAAKARKA
jgi:carbon-monoxide dehydrogenase small subunit/xanthine dehydrogenase YagT iron-sulfur-binding subunit